MLVDLENIIIIIVCMYYIFSYFFQPNWREYSNSFIDYMTGHRISEIETRINSLNNYINELKHNLEIEKIKEPLDIHEVKPEEKEIIEHDDVSDITDVSDGSGVSDVS